MNSSFSQNWLSERNNIGIFINILIKACRVKVIGILRFNGAVQYDDQSWNVDGNDVVL